MNRADYFIGIDEVGRGPLAGPVTLGGFLTSRYVGFAEFARRSGLRLADSKKLSGRLRSAWCEFVRSEYQGAFVVVSVGQRFIDERGISAALTKGAMQVASKLIRQLPKDALVDIYLDGSLYLHGQVRAPICQRVRVPADGAWIEAEVKTIVRGDEKIPNIALASIMAKVHRDRLMIANGFRFPGYGFEINKGYGTSQHISAIRELGPSPIHRLTFISKYLKVSQRK